MRKFLALVLALVMTMSLVTVSAGAATDFTDDAKITNVEAVEVLNAIGVLGGYDDGSFRPDAVLTRGAGAKLLAYLMLGQEKADNLKATYTAFADVTDTVGLAAYIEWAAALGIVEGYGDGNFGPYNPLTEYAFGKMLLGALKYDSTRQGYNTTGWQTRVIRDAVKKGIFDGTESGLCTRDTAARMCLATLESSYVVYGDKIISGDYVINNEDDLIPQLNAVLVNGVYDTHEFVWETYGDLEFNGTAFDTWGNLGDRWVYEGEEIGFYEDEVVVTYTEKVEFCDLLVDLGVAEKSNDRIALTVIYNGEDSYTYADGNEFYKVSDLGVTTDEARFGHVWAANRCDERFVGGQGVLTKVFQLEGTNRYWATEVATYLAKVTDVDDTHNGVYTEFSVAWADLDMFGTDAGAYNNGERDLHDEADDRTKVIWEETDAYEVDDYALVTVRNDVIIDHEAVAGVQGKLTRASMDVAALEKDNFISTTYVDGDKKMDAFGFRNDYAAVKNDANLLANFIFFYDVYGNMIGAVKPDVTTTYAVLDDVWSYHEKDGTNEIFANIVDLDGVNNKGMSVSEFNGEKAADVDTKDDDVFYHCDAVVLEIAKQNRAAHSYRLYKYTETDGVYTLQCANATRFEKVQHSTAASAIDDLLDKATGNVVAELTNLTKFVLRDTNGNYTAVTGLKNLPALQAAYAEVIYDTVETDEATIVYLHGVTFEGDKKIGYLARPNALTFTSVDDTEYYVYEFYFGTTAEEIYVTADDKAVIDNAVTGGTGLYEIQLNAVDNKKTVDTIKALDNTTDPEFYEGNWYVDYQNDISKTGKIAFNDGSGKMDYDCVDDMMVYIVDTGRYTVKAGSLKDLDNGVNVEFVYNDTTDAVEAVYVLLSR